MEILGKLPAIFLLAFAVGVVSGVPFHIGLHSAPTGQEGEVVAFSRTRFDVYPIINEVFGEAGARSYCYLGAWALYSPVSHQYSELTFFSEIITSTPYGKCDDFHGISTEFHAAVRLGPEDTRIRAITFFTKTELLPLAYFSPNVTVVEGVAETRLNHYMDDITSICIIITGRSEWTVFEEEGFKGRSFCLKSYEEIEEFPGTVLEHKLKMVGSVVRGCGRSNGEITSEMSE